MEDNTNQTTLRIIYTLLQTIEVAEGNPEVALASVTTQSVEQLKHLPIEELQEIRNKLEAVAGYIFLLNEKRDNKLKGRLSTNIIKEINAIVSNNQTTYEDRIDSLEELYDYNKSLRSKYKIDENQSVEFEKNIYNYQSLLKKLMQIEEGY